MQGGRNRKLRLGVLASHGGSNLQAIMDACEQRRLSAEVGVVISNNSRSPALARARAARTVRVSHQRQDASRTGAPRRRHTRLPSAA